VSERDKSALLALVTCLWGVPSALANVNAEFDLRLAPHETDSILAPGETLDLEIYMRLSSDGPIPNVTAWSVFLDVVPSEDGVITFNGVFIDELGFGIILPQGTDNSPETGDFSRAAFSLSPLALPEDTWLHAASFSITAQDLGRVTYGFVDAPPQRPWAVSFQDGTSANVSVVSTPTIAVRSPVAVPGPGRAALVLMAIGLLAAGRRAMGRKEVSGR